MARCLAFPIAVILSGILSSAAIAAGPFGTIRVGAWSGGAYTDDKTGAFSHCVAGTTYGSGINVMVGRNASGNWLLGFANPAFRLSPGETFPIDVTFDGQSQFKLFGTAISPNLVSSVLPNNAAIEQFRKSNLMVAQAKGATFQFNLTSTGQLLPVIANCVDKIKSSGIANAGDFSIAVPKPVAKPVLQSTGPASAPKSSKTVELNGTGFVVSTSGHVVTNDHVISSCVGDVRGNLTGQGAMTLRTVSRDETNDLALLPGSH